jgi:hypothetical protein
LSSSVWLAAPTSSGNCAEPEEAAGEASGKLLLRIAHPSLLAATGAAAAHLRADVLLQDHAWGGHEVVKAVRAARVLQKFGVCLACQQGREGVAV